jgi:hypothetical protein
MVIENAFCAEPEAASFACTVKLKVPAVCALPPITPEEPSDNPPGNDPVTTVHEYGAVPPDAASVCE